MLANIQQKFSTFAILITHNLKMSRLIILLLITIPLHALSQIQCGKAIDPQSISFQHGEELKYEVKYSASIFTTSIADVTFHTQVEQNGFKITAIGKTRPFYSIFFEMEDIYHTLLSRETLRPIRTTSRIREGGYQYRTAFDYNWNTNKVKTFGQNIKSGNSYNKTMTLTDCSYDALALFYNLRCVDISTMKFGEKRRLNLVLEDTIRTVEYRLIGREEFKLDKKNTFRTIKVACQIATASDDALKDGSEFYIWLSDDNNRIPIYMESPIRVGSIKVYLSGWVNLKFPFNAKLAEKY